MNSLPIAHEEIAAPRYAIGNVRISAVTMAEKLRILDQQVQSGKSAYVCVTNRITTLLSQEDEEYRKIQNESFLTLPDGMPLVWFAKLKLAGVKNAERVTGPDLMMRVFEVSVESGYSHYFLGDTEGTLAKMGQVISKRYLGTNIKRTFSPPFRPLSEVEIISVANTTARTTMNH